MGLLFRWIRSWLGKFTPLSHLKIVMYSRHGCHLCEKAWLQLKEKQSQYQFQLEVVDVDSDQEQVKLHGEHVPVVLVNEKIRFRGEINPILLQRLLDGEIERNPES